MLWLEVKPTFENRALQTSERTMVHTVVATLFQMENKHLGIQDILFKLTHPLLDTSLSKVFEIKVCVCVGGGGGGGGPPYGISIIFQLEKLRSLVPSYLQVPLVFIVPSYTKNITNCKFVIICGVTSMQQTFQALWFVVCAPSPFPPSENDATTYLHVLRANMCRDNLIKYIPVGFSWIPFHWLCKLEVCWSVAFLQQHL